MLGDEKINKGNIFDGGDLNTIESQNKDWNSLSLKEKSDIIRVAIKNGITTLPQIKEKYNEFANGGNLYGGGGSVTWKSSARKGADPVVNEQLLNLLAKYGQHVIVTSGSRSKPIKATGSWHMQGGGKAVDIVPNTARGTTFESIENAIFSNPELYTFFLNNRLSFLDETGRSAESKATMRKTGATGPHFHIGYDTKVAPKTAARIRSIMGGASSSAPQPTATTTTAGPAYQAMRYLMGKGLTQAQAAGMVGSLMGESGENLNIGAVNPTSGAYGIAQWLGPRKRNLFAKYGNSPTLEQQLDYLWDELNTTHSNGLKYLRQAQTPQDAADAAFGWYEFSVGPDGALQAMRRTGQNGSQRMLRGRKFASQLMGQDYVGMGPSSNGDASFAPWLTQPLDNRDLYGDMMDAPSLQQPKGPTPEEIERAERERGTRNFFTVMNLLNTPQDTSSGSSIWDTPLMAAVEQFSRSQSSPYAVDTSSLSMPSVKLFAKGGKKDDDDEVVYASPEEQQAYNARWKGHIPLGFEETQEGVFHNFNTGETLVNYPGVTVTSTSKRKAPSYYDVNHPYTSSYNPNGLMEFIDTTVGMPMGLLSPTHVGRGLYNHFTGDGSQGNFFQDLFLSNNGVFSDEFAREHPYVTMVGNLVGDAAAFGTGSALWKMPKYRAALQAENAAAQRAVADQWGSMANRGAVTQAAPSSKAYSGSMTLFERPVSKLSARERLGLPKGSKVYTEAENSQFLNQINDFAAKHGYPGLEKGNYTAQELESYARALIDRHNSFYRGVVMPEGEDLAAVKRILGENASDEYIMRYMATHGKQGENGMWTFTSSKPNAFIYGKTARVTRPYSLGTDRTKWFTEGDYPLVAKDSGTEWSSFKDYKGMLDPWAKPVEDVYGNIVYPQEVPNEVVSVNQPMLFRGWAGEYMPQSNKTADTVFSYRGSTSGIPEITVENAVSVTPEQGTAAQDAAVSLNTDINPKLPPAVKAIKASQKAEKDIAEMNKYHSENVEAYNMATGSDVKSKPFRTDVTGSQTKVLSDNEFNEAVKNMRTNSPREGVDHIGGLYSRIDDTTYLRSVGSPSTAYHEFLHRGDYGVTNPEVTKWRIEQLVDPDKIANMSDKSKAYYLSEGEFPVHLRQQGESMGIKVGEPFPGEESFDDMLFNNGKFGASIYVKGLDPAAPLEDKKLAWKALNGTAFQWMPWLVGGGTAVSLYPWENNPDTTK